jgi:hypothetical protein
VDDSGASDLRPIPSGHQFRPPPGFMNDAPLDDAAANMDPDVMLNRLRSRAGQWHQLAKLLPALYSKGYESNTIDEMTGVNPAEQNRWVVAGTVYDSIAATGQLSEQYMQQFDAGGEMKLYHFRFLPIHRRAAAALYIVDQGLDDQVRSDPVSRGEGVTGLHCSRLYCFGVSRSSAPAAAPATTRFNASASKLFATCCTCTCPSLDAGYSNSIHSSSSSSSSSRTRRLCLVPGCDCDCTKAAAPFLILPKGGTLAGRPYHISMVCSSRPLGVSCTPSPSNFHGGAAAAVCRCSNARSWPAP